MQGQLAGQVTIVTGGSRGIGRAIAVRFADEGALAVIASRTAPEGLSDRAIVWQPTDVSDRTEVEALIQFTIERYSRVDVLVNNAGVQLEKSIVQTTDEDWEQLIGVNMRGLFLCCRSVIPVMQRQGGGVILNIGSISAAQADPNMAIYNASKAFVHSLTRSIAVDHGQDGIRCNAICPGWITTELAAKAFAQAANPDQAQRVAITQHPLGRLGKPKEIAATAVWLASAEAAFATGQCFTIDGGLTAASPINPKRLGRQRE